MMDISKILLLMMMICSDEVPWPTQISVHSPLMCTVPTHVFTTEPWLYAKYLVNCAF